MPITTPNPAATDTFTLPITPEQLRAKNISLCEEASGVVIVGNLTLGPITESGKPLFQGIAGIRGDLNLDQVRVLRLGSLESCENLFCQDCHFSEGLGDLAVIKKSLQATRSDLGEAGKLGSVGESMKLTAVEKSCFSALTRLESLALRDCDRVVFPSLKTVGKLTHVLSDPLEENEIPESQRSSEDRPLRPTPFPALRFVLREMTVRHGLYSPPLALPRLLVVNGSVRLCGDIVGKTDCRGVLARVAKDLILEGEGGWDNLVSIRGALTLPTVSIRAKAFREPPTSESLRVKSPFPSLRFVARDIHFITTATCGRSGTAFIPETCYGKVTLAGMSVTDIQRMRNVAEWETAPSGQIGGLQHLNLMELQLNGATVSFPSNLQVLSVSLKARGTLFTSAPAVCIAAKTLDIRGATLPGNTIKDKVTKTPLWLRPPLECQTGGNTGLNTIELGEGGERGADGVRRFLAVMSKHRRLIRRYEKFLGEGLSPEAAMAATEAPAPDWVQLDGFSACLPPHLAQEYQSQVVKLSRMLSLRLTQTLGSAADGAPTWDFLVRHAHDAPIHAFTQAVCSAGPDEISSLHILACESSTLPRILADLLIHTRLAGTPLPTPVAAFISDALKNPEIRGLTVVALTRGAYASPKPEDFRHPLMKEAIRGAEWELIAEAPEELTANLAELTSADCQALKDHWFQSGAPPEALCAVLAQTRINDTSFAHVPVWFVPCEEHCEWVAHRVEKILSRKNRTGIEQELSVLRLTSEYWRLPIMEPMLALMPRLIGVCVDLALSYPRAAKSRIPWKWWTDSVLHAPLTDEQWRDVFLRHDLPREFCLIKPRTMSAESFRIFQLSLI